MTRRLAKDADLPKLVEGLDPREMLTAERVSALFHMVNRLLPEGQEVFSVPPSMQARDALKLMRKHGFSQVPVQQGSSVLGIFSYRAFALEVAQMSDHKVDPSSLPVEEFLDHEDPVYARVRDEFRKFIELLDENNFVMVGEPDKCLGILTPMDVLRYLYPIANTFVLIEGIELTLCFLIRAGTHDEVSLRSCIANALSDKYKTEGSMPQCLEDMTFDEYVALIRDGRNWSQFEPVFGGTRDRVRSRLEPIRDLRNDIFHFRRRLTVNDRKLLTSCRDWLFRCARKMQAQGDQR
jgi:predicted transcriptional regulator